MILTKHRIQAAAAALLAVVVVWLFIWPCHPFEGESYSTVVVDRDGQLIGARVSSDQQWRFPSHDSLPQKFITALITFEDRGFRSHLGISPSAIVRATIQNIRAGRIRSGASTITMQVARMDGHRHRTILSKLIECAEALRIEAHYTKDEILSLYASHAPFGGNVVGYDAAAWRYLGHDGRRISWAEAATMAVLQNSPSLINLSKGRQLLIDKRDRLLTRLHHDGHLSTDEYTLALAEPLTAKPMPLPNIAPHLTEWYASHAPGRRSVSSIDADLQRHLISITDLHSRTLANRGAADLAAVVIELHSGRIAAYIGNSDLTRRRIGSDVDIALSPRSSGSVLKPALYCAALQDGIILPHSLIADVPININGFRPHNFSMGYSGATPASEALSQSLNVPYVLLLREYGIARFIDILQRAGLTTIHRSEDDYGLSLILGGAEVTLLDVTQMYGEMARIYLGIPPTQDTSQGPEQKADLRKRFSLTDRLAIYHTICAMQELTRPDPIDNERTIRRRQVAWKTGTSFGSRDAWSVGIDTRYAVGVWVGNADGSTCQGMTGMREAAPVMFDIFGYLRDPHHEWYTAPPASEGLTTSVCTKSGMLAGPDCTPTADLLIPKAGIHAPLCPYHKRIAVSLDGTHRVENQSEPSREQTAFVLPPNVEHYYRPLHPDYTPLPPLAQGTESQTSATIRLIYPQSGAVINIPSQDNESSAIAAELAHKHTSHEVFWFVDGHLTTTTRHMHQAQLQLTPGTHTITCVDESGESTSVHFTVRE